MSRNVDEVDITIGATLRRIRTHHGMNLETVGHSIGVTYQQIQKYETGANRVSARNLYLLARFFQLEFIAFYDRLDITAPAPEDRIVSNQLARINDCDPELAKTLMDLINALAARKQ